jgi:hypothetical protein
LIRSPREIINILPGEVKINQGSFKIYVMKDEIIQEEKWQMQGEKDIGSVGKVVLFYENKKGK